MSGYRIRFPRKLRFQHCYLPGKTGAGKSTLLNRIILTDIYAGAGVTVIDPKGDLIVDVLSNIPRPREKDVVYLSLDNKTPFDFLAHEGDLERDELVEDLIFLLLNDAGNAPRAKGILYDVLYTILSSEVPICFLDITRFLTEKKRRDEILLGVKNPRLKKIWDTGVPKDEKVEPILYRMKKYLHNSSLNVIFGTPNPPIKMKDILDNRKILLVNLGGATRAAMDYGSLVFQKIKQEVFRRHRTPAKLRVPHYVFIDEFDNFAQVEDFNRVLLMARGYKVSFTLANPSFSILPSDIKSGLGIIRNYIMFCLSHEDLPHFKHLIPKPPQEEEWYIRAYEAIGEKPPAPPCITPEDLINLPDYSAAYKIGSSDMIIKETPAPLMRSNVQFARSTLKRTVDNLGCEKPKDVVGLEEDGNHSGEPAKDPTNVLPHSPKTGGSQRSRGVRNPHDQGSR